MMQRLAGVDVPDTGDETLIEQQHFQRDPLPCAGTREDCGVERRVERFGSDRGKRFMLGTGANHIHQAKAARVVEGHHHA